MAAARQGVNSVVVAAVVVDVNAVATGMTAAAGEGAAAGVDVVTGIVIEVGAGVVEVTIGIESSPVFRRPVHLLDQFFDKKAAYRGRPFCVPGWFKELRKS